MKSMKRRRPVTIEELKAEKERLWAIFNEKDVARDEAAKAWSDVLHQLQDAEQEERIQQLVAERLEAQKEGTNDSH
jgi:uncharacterized small protein (DUF1192 family)